MEARRLTKRIVDQSEPLDREFTIWDRDISGFGLRVYPSGRKVYLFKYRVGGGRAGTIRKPVIGTHGALTVDQARAIANDWAAEVRRGNDPSAERQRRRTAPTMMELFARYLNEHARPYKKPASIANDERLIEKRLEPIFGRRKVAEVGRAEVADFHRKMADTPYEGNRALALLSKMFNLAELWEMRPDGSNPCRHIRKFREEKRERFLSQKELARLGSALERAERGEVLTRKNGAISRSAIAAIRLLVFTGARSGEILSLKWEHINFEAGRLELPDSKTGAKFVRLPPPALAILRDIDRVESNPYVIPGAKRGAHLVNLKDPWNAIREAAGLNDLRIHDLRHSFASIGAAGGMSLAVIGALLGHREVSTTARYAHLSDDPLKSAANEIGRCIEDAMLRRTESV